MATKMVSIPLKIPPATIDEAEQVAARVHLTRSAVMRLAIERGLTVLEHQLSQPIPPAATLKLHPTPNPDRDEEGAQ